MESQPQNPEFWNNPENFHPCKTHFKYLLSKWIHCAHNHNILQKKKKSGILLTNNFTYHMTSCLGVIKHLAIKLIKEWWELCLY